MVLECQGRLVFLFCRAIILFMRRSKKRVQRWFLLCLLMLGGVLNLCQVIEIQRVFSSVGLLEGMVRREKQEFGRLIRIGIVTIRSGLWCWAATTSSASSADRKSVV